MPQGDWRVPLLYYPPEETDSSHTCTLYCLLCVIYLSSLWARPSSAGRRESSLGASNWTLELIGELD